ncbi:hypothetical protein BC629DRAFT_911995 [Irpex lacteus]|nr:hypothetical protein BC629DRAFT_911995 [Irpex lacteus]
MWMIIDRTGIGTEYTTTALLVYDYSLTLPQEVEHIWRRRTSMITILFFINRYSIILIRGFSVVQLVSLGGSSESEFMADRMHCSIEFHQGVLDLI